MQCFSYLDFSNFSYLNSTEDTNPSGTAIYFSNQSLSCDSVMRNIHICYFIIILIMSFGAMMTWVLYTKRMLGITKPITKTSTSLELLSYKLTRKAEKGEEKFYIFISRFLISCFDTNLCYLLMLMRTLKILKLINDKLFGICHTGYLFLLIGLVHVSSAWKCNTTHSITF